MGKHLKDYFQDSLPQLRRETFTDKKGKELKVLGSTERLLCLIVILDRTDDDTQLYFQGTIALSNETGIDRTNVRKVLADLKLAGWLIPAGKIAYKNVTQQKIAGSDSKKSPLNAYRLSLPGFAQVAPETDAEVMHMGGNNYPPLNDPKNEKWGVTGGVTGGVTTTPLTITITKPPTEKVSDTAIDPIAASPGGEISKEKELALKLYEYDGKTRGVIKAPAIQKKRKGECLDIVSDLLSKAAPGTPDSLVLRVGAQILIDGAPGKQDMKELRMGDQAYYKAEAG
jgi:hypothetical protein